jgi:hypothetical protein
MWTSAGLTICPSVPGSVTTGVAGGRLLEVRVTVTLTALEVVVAFELSVARAVKV